MPNLTIVIFVPRLLHHFFVSSLMGEVLLIGRIWHGGLREIFNRRPCAITGACSRNRGAFISWLVLAQNKATASLSPDDNFESSIGLSNHPGATTGASLATCKKDTQADSA
jgi:hypothetical protein